MACRAGMTGRAAAWVSAFLLTVYTVTTILGFLSLSSPDEPMGDPWFTLMELLIVLILPFMVVSMVSLYAGAPRERKGRALAALVFMVLTAGISSSVHFVILTVSRRIGAADFPWFDLFFSFKWPSVVYALDILAWDLFFALSMLFGAAVFGKGRLERAARLLMIISGLLSLAGLAGVLLGNMQVRNIGILGYTVAAIAAFVLMGAVSGRTRG